MTLTISENWIRERVQLRENADDVRSLALPGTYHEKVTHLGNALLSFCRLKHLDLSRNALQSLDGIQHLTMLEKLNLYYNNVATLKELYKLRHNTLLEEVDLRLNPVTKNEPDYRLFMVHMLPNLRKLDDRSIRDSERKAALMHFNTDQASELTEHPPQVIQVATDKQSIPRADYVKSMAKKSTALDDDDCEILDLIARTGDLNLPQPISGSTASYPQARKHTLEEMRLMDQNERPNRIPNDSPSRRHTTNQDETQSPTQGGYRTQYATHGYNGIDPRIGSDGEEMDPLMNAGVAITPLRKYFPSVMAHASPPTPPTPEMPEIAPGILTPSESPNTSFQGTTPLSYEHEWRNHTRGTQSRTQDTTHPRQNPSQGREKVQVQFSDNVETRLIEGHDSNLRFTDESKAYTAYTSRGHFTPHPGLSGNQTQDQQAALSSRNSGQPNLTVPPVTPSNQNMPNGSHDQYASQSGPTRDVFSEPPPVQRTIEETPERKEETLSSNQKQDAGVDQHQFIEKLLNLVDRYWNGSKSLHRHAKFQSQAQSLMSNFITEVTTNSQQETDRLHQDVARFAQENVSLRNQLASHRSNNNASARSQIDQSKLQLSLEQAQQDVNALKHQLQLSMQENQRLQETLTSTPVYESVPQPPQPTTNNIAINQQVDKEMLNTLETEVESLQRDNVTLKLQLKHFTQLQELAAMLQESHKSLVTTNDHLLKELDESKLRHGEEVKQLHWSYGELKRTMELTGNSALSGSAGNRGRMSGGETGVKMNGVM
ncbi:centrosomal protein of 72 kDa-like isoform X2 [Amphiura filiformis]|uniref:centrosomal protein of 72 kDa-like isoform X2 n=1 Tax=Amphiura filiformis TaxID=82378 RepID=UPI003B20D253